MADRIFDAVIFVKQTPTIGYDSGLFHVCYEIGRGINAEFVMLPSVFNRAMVSADAARADWQEEGSPRKGNITRLRSKR